MTVKKQIKHLYDGFVSKIGLTHGQAETSQKRRIGTIKHCDERLENASLKNNSTATRSRNDQNLHERPNEEDARTLAMFLDLLIKDTQANPSKLIPYTRQLDKELDDLLEGVVLD